MKFRSLLSSACDSELQNTCDQHTFLGHCCLSVEWEGPTFDIILPSNEHVGGRQQDRCIPEEGKPGQGVRSPGTLSGVPSQECLHSCSSPMEEGAIIGLPEGISSDPHE